MKRVNLTRHKASPEQNCAPRDSETEKRIKELVLFETLPTVYELEKRALALARLAYNLDATEAMIGGAGYLMPYLERALTGLGIEPVYAFSQRESSEVVQPDGSTRKVTTFRHIGFVRNARATEYEWLSFFANYACDFIPAYSLVLDNAKDAFIRSAGKNLPLGYNFAADGETCLD